MSDPQNGKGSGPRSSSNIKRNYRDAVIDWSKDVNGKPRTTHADTVAMKSKQEAAQNVVDYFEGDNSQDCE